MPKQKHNYISVFIWSLVVALCALPLVTIFFRVIPKPHLFHLIWEPSVVKSLVTTLMVGSCSLMLALLFALPVSYLTTRTNVPLRIFFQNWLFFPYFIPSFLFAIAWTVLALPQVGLLNKVAGMDWVSIYTFPGLVFVSCNAFFPIVVTTLSKGFLSMDPSLEEAARVCGASPLTVFRRVTLPCQWPTVFGASALFLLLVFSSFGIPAIIGSPAKLYVLTTQIYTFSKMGGLDGAEKGFVISLWLIVFAALLISLRRWINHAYQVKLTTGKVSRASLTDLGAWKLPAALFLSFLFFIFIILPIGSIFLSSFLGVAGEVRLSNFTLANYRYLFQMKETASAFINSFALAFLGGVFCCALGLGVSYYVNRYPNRQNYLLEACATLPFSIPGTVIALALIVSFGRLWGVGHISLLGTPLLLLLAYISKDLAIAVQTLTPALGQIDKSLDEAGRVCGASPSEVTDKILFPLIFPVLRGVFFLSALPMISELTMSVLLFGPGTETVGTLIFQLQDYANPLASCALASLVILLLTTGIFVTSRLSRKI